MTTAIQIIQRAYEAFGRGDVPVLLSYIADDVDWECVVSNNVPYAGKRRTPAEVGEFFAALADSDKIHTFEPREFIEADGHVTVLGWEDTTAMENGRRFSSEWLHLFTVRNGKIVRWRGFYNTAARHGL